MLKYTFILCYNLFFSCSQIESPLSEIDWPELKFKPHKISDTIFIGTEKQPDTFYVWNRKNNQLEFKIKENKGWLSCTPDSGKSLNPNDKNTIIISYEIQTSKPKIYATEIYLFRQYNVEPETVFVSIEVIEKPNPKLVVNKIKLLPDIRLDGIPTKPDTFLVWNGGNNGILNYKIETTDIRITCQPNHGTSSGISETDTIIVQYNTKDYDKDEKSTSYIIIEGQEDKDSVRVDFKVEKPDIGIRPNKLKQTLIQNDDIDALDTFHIWNSASGATLNYKIECKEPWFSCEPTEGESINVNDKDTILVQYSPNEMAPNIYHAIIEISDVNFPNVIRNLTVSLEITPAPDVLNDPIIDNQTFMEGVGIVLNWYDNNSNESGYIVKKDSYGKFVEIAQLPPNSTKYIDTITSIGTIPKIQKYCIQAYTSTNNSDCTEITGEYYLINPPTNLTISHSTHDSIISFNLKWDDNSNIETGYLIEQKTTNSFIIIDSLPEKSRSYSATLNLNNLDGNKVTYRVKAIIDGIHSLPSNQWIYYLKSEKLVAYYPFNGDAKDKSGNSYDGLIFGVLADSDRFGNSKSAAYFDGESYIDLGNNNLISDTYSFSVWVKLSKLDTWATIINKFFVNSGWYLGVSPSGFITMTFGAQFSFDRLQGGQIELNKWTHIVVTYNGSVLIIFQDGKLVAKKISKQTIGYKLTQRINTLIGFETTLMSDPFYGTIDELKIFDYAIDNNKVIQLYNETSD